MPRKARNAKLFIFLVNKSRKRFINNMNSVLYAKQAQAEKKLGLTDIRPTMYLKITGYGSLPMPNVPMSVHC